MTLANTIATAFTARDLGYTPTIATADMVDADEAGLFPAGVFVDSDGGSGVLGVAGYFTDHADGTGLAGVMPLLPA